MRALRVPTSRAHVAPTKRRASFPKTQLAKIIEDSKPPPFEIELPRNWGARTAAGLGAFFGRMGPWGAGAVLLGMVGPTLLGSEARADIVAPPAPPTPAPAETSVGPASWDPGSQPSLAIKASGPTVRRLQDRLAELGYTSGGLDSVYGRGLRAAVTHYQIDRGISPTGKVGPVTWAELAKTQTPRPPEPTLTPGGTPILDRYPAYAPETRALFREAAAIAGVPASWADADGLHRLIASESDGFVGRPNYTYGRMSTKPAQWTVVHAELILGLKMARSSATGLGQLLLDNVESYYPSGRLGIGRPLEEAVGMLRYIKARYATPAAAWADYNDNHEGY